MYVFIVFICIALNTFEIDANRNANVFMYDRDGTAISTDLFELVVMQYLPCNWFLIRLNISTDGTFSEFTEVTKLMIK